MRWELYVDYYSLSNAMKRSSPVLSKKNYVITGHLASVHYHEIEDIQIAAFVFLILGRLLHAIDLT